LGLPWARLFIFKPSTVVESTIVVESATVVESVVLRVSVELSRNWEGRRDWELVRWGNMEKQKRTRTKSWFVFCDVLTRPRVSFLVLP